MQTSLRIYLTAGIVLGLAGLGVGIALSVPRPAGDTAKQPAGNSAVRTKETSPNSRQGDQTDPYVDVELDPEKQEKIWEAEHVTFEIEQRFGEAFTAALKGRDADRLKRFFLDKFEGTLPVSFQEQRQEQAGVSAVHRTASDEHQPADRQAIVHHLLDWLTELSSIEKVGLRVLSIKRGRSIELSGPVASASSGPGAAQGQSDEPLGIWETTLLLSVRGRDASGRQIERKSRHTARFKIVDEQALAEMPSLMSWDVQSETYRAARAEPLFEEVTEKLGLDRVDLPDNWELNPAQVTQYRFQVAVDDFNRDGLLDIAAATHGESLLLMRDALTEPFRDVTTEMGLHRHHAQRGTPGSLTASIDANNDGYPDLLLGTRFYLNDGGTRFIDRTAQSGLRFLPLPGAVRIGEPMGACVADYDGDGLLDLYVVKQGFSRLRTKPKAWIEDHEHGYPNQLWRNLGNGRFVDVTKETGTGGGHRHSLAACFFFYDDDRWPDLYIANDFGQNVLLRNRGDGTFEDVSSSSGAADFATTMGVAAGDLDNDAINELYVANMYSKMGRRIIEHVAADDYPPGIYEQIRGSCAGNRLYWRSNLAEPFTERASDLNVDSVGWAYAPAMIDVDNDGWLDLYATTGFLSFARGEPDG